MRNLKILNAALLCVPKILANICAPNQGKPGIMIMNPGQLENCATPNKPLIYNPPAGQQGRPGSDCIVGGGQGGYPSHGGLPSQNGSMPQICTSGNYPGSNMPGGNYPGGNMPGGQNLIPGQGIPTAPGGQYPMVPGQGILTMPGQYTMVPQQPPQYVPVVPVVPAAPVQSAVPAPAYPPSAPQPPNVTQIIQSTPPPATTIIQPTTPQVPSTNVPAQPTKPPGQETQCTVKQTVDCVPINPEEEVPEVPTTPGESTNPNNPQGNNPPAQTIVHVTPAPTTPPMPPQYSPQPCIPQQVNPPSSNTGASNLPYCIPNNSTGSPSYSQQGTPQGTPNGLPQGPVNAIYVPTVISPPASAPTTDCASPANLINSLCDTAAQQGQSMGYKGGNCDVQSNIECLNKMINSPPQASPYDAMECVTPQKPMVDVGVLVPASDAYLQAHQNVCVQ
ncbi:hypothetical protein AAJ76_1900028347 [Vairimorpha ceranae]|uniref:Polar tube protein 1 n=1 Tax=Vairimorpha ceranae TaxID=40302 RepID=A0A0F9WFJ9_9MICR|nr:hypothetical protein AAJ76_1900028347 [Vairimorpha ceranae]KAF5139731.1 hypothetical protein G9O61_00g021140 [Vairimorpha ceranae]KKO75500.1 hypothetical protein AAJ76_1900028347 [Vairimorpha ceranae]